MAAKGSSTLHWRLSENLGLEGEFNIVGIAKKDEKKGEVRDKIFKPGRANPLGFGREGELLLFLQRVRDEAHRFAVTFHRKRRAKKSLQSASRYNSGRWPEKQRHLAETISRP